MLSEVSVSSTSVGRRDGQRQAPSKSPAPVALSRTSEKEPPPYGAQHHQDALWEGGNDALPPLWHQFQVSDLTVYQDDTLVIATINRPLPGVRLDDPGDLVDPIWEWHISPFGRSYFVNHNTRTTSWNDLKPERPAGSLTPERIIEGHSKYIWSLAYLKASCNVMSASEDGSIRQWKRDGEPVGKSWEGGGGPVQSIAVHLDDTMVVSGSLDGRLRLWNVKEGSMIGDPWEGHDAPVRCLDWSPDALEIASGSQDGTIRRWNPDTGRQMAPLIKTSYGWVMAVKYSPQGDKIISGGGRGRPICVWSRDGKLLIEIKGYDAVVTSLCWSKDGAHIFSGSADHTIRKWRAIDGKELVVLRGHTNAVRSLCLTPNERYIVSASDDYSVRIWDLQTNQAVGDPLLHDDRVFAVAVAPAGKCIASAGIGGKIYIWSLDAALERHQGADDNNAKLKGRPAQPRVVRQPIPNTGGSAKYGKDFFVDHSNNHTSPSANSSFNWRSLFGSLRFSARPTDAPRPSPRESRRWNFSLHPVGKSSRTVDVALAQDEDRYGITPETDAEAAAAMQRTNSNQADNSTQPGQPAAGAQASQVQPLQTQAQVSTVGLEDIACGVSCCGTFIGFRRSASHQP
ncbi:WD40 repeat-like protein [Suillus brevipes Sb2]|nr:WD40 repeat-like protein [Suillus brevipes Sb2]